MLQATAKVSTINAAKKALEPNGFCAVDIFGYQPLSAKSSLWPGFHEQVKLTADLQTSIQE